MIEGTIELDVTRTDDDDDDVEVGCAIMTDFGVEESVDTETAASVELETSVVSEGSDAPDKTNDASAAVIAVPNISAAASSATWISASETGSSSVLQPICIGVRRSSSTEKRLSAHVDSIHDSSVLSRLSAVARHISLWASSESVLYPAASIHARAQSAKVKTTLPSLASLLVVPCAYDGRRRATTSVASRRVAGSILLDLLLQTSETLL